MVTNGAKRARKIKPKILMVTAALNRKNTFHQQIELNFKEETSEVLR
jgi:hypothetical protein